MSGGVWEVLRLASSACNSQINQKVLKGYHLNFENSLYGKYGDKKGWDASHPQIGDSDGKIG